MRRYLVVANQTLGGDQLLERLDALLRGGPCRFHLVVPVTQTEASNQWSPQAIDGVLPDAYKIARALAEARLEHEMTRLRDAGAEVSGEVVDAVPVDHISQLASAGSYDEVIVSTLPRRLSRWLVLDIPHRIERAIKMPVDHVVGSPGPSL